jgi:glucose-6-phosphate isomerase
MEAVAFDFNNTLSHAIGDANGISPPEIANLKPALSSAHAAVERFRAAGSLGFLKLPYQQDGLGPINLLARKIAREFDNFVVLGIGGSALGNIALHNSLRHPFHNLLSRQERGNCPRIFVEDNVDPDHIAGLIDTLDLKRTCFNVITKSGDTVETMGTFFLVRDLLLKQVPKKYLARHFVATTSAAIGSLRQIAHEEGFQTLEIPETVGGRFSVLSTVGLLSAAVAGIPISKLLQGAQAMDKACQSADPQKNPALLSAALHYLAYQKGRPISVLMPYAQGLKEIADWYAQLCAESLGKAKNRKGQAIYSGLTPVKALGVTDQHSQLQLYQEGPQDKVVTFITVENFKRPLRIPDAYKGKDIDYLSGHTFQELIHAEQKATELSLTKASRPNATIRLSSVTPQTIGMLLHYFQMQTAYAGELFDIDAFNQPGVEAGKKLAYGMLGRKGFEGERGEMRRASTNKPNVSVRVS